MSSSHGKSGLLDDFHDAQARVDRSNIAKKLANAGITIKARMSVGGIGVAEITINGRTYEPTEPGLGKMAIILPVYQGPIPTPTNFVEDPALIDLLAFSSRRPSQWWLRRDTATILGDAVLDELFLDAPLHVFRNPLSWLRAGGDGVVVLDWVSARRELPVSCRKFVAEDASHAREVYRKLTIPAIVPDVYVARGAA